MGLQPVSASFAELHHSKLPREPVCMAVTGLYSTGCPKQLWMVLVPGYCHPQKIPIVTVMADSPLGARRHSSLRNSHSEQHAKQEL